MLPVLLNLDTCSVVSDTQKDNRSLGQLAGLWLQICGKLAPCHDHPNAQVQVKPEVRLIAPQQPSIPAAGCTDQLKISVKTRQRCVKRRGRIRWVLTWAIAAYRADLGSRPSYALKECPALGKIYENSAFPTFGGGNCHLPSLLATLCPRDKAVYYTVIARSTLSKGRPLQ